MALLERDLIRARTKAGLDAYSYRKLSTGSASAAFIDW